MLEAIHFLKPWRCFKGDEVIPFRAGVNLLVGDQGCGKSSLFQAIQVLGMKKPGSFHLPQKDSVPAILDYRGESSPVFAFDFEQDNFRIKSFFNGAMTFHIGAMFHSHGEMVMAMINMWLKIDKAMIVLVDEPDMALSIRSCYKLVRAFKHLAELGGQVIATAHNPVVIGGFDEVYSLEHQRWMPSSQFIETQFIETQSETQS